MEISVLEISIISLCLVLSAFFSGMEIAFISSNKIFLGIEKLQNNFSSKILTKLTEKPSKYIASMLVGNNISLVIYGFFMGDLLLRWINLYLDLSSFSSLLLQTTVSTLLILITSEFLPKVFFQIYANNLIKILAFPAYIFYQIFYFISSFLIWISDFILRKLFNTHGDQEQLFFSKDELGSYISEQMNTVNKEGEVDSEIQIFQNALEFSGVKAREIMNPRTEIAAIEINDTVENLKTMFVETGYSKILVYENSIDDVLGYVHSFDLFKKPKTIKNIMIPVEFIPETIFIKDAMNLLTKKRKSVAVVLDEYGGTSGMITMEDIVEELFGEIDDEHDLDQELIEEKIDDNNYLFSTRLDVEYINQEYKLNIPEDDSYSTLGGFIVDFTKELPQKGTQILIGNFHFNIEQATKNKIELVKLSILD